MGAAGGIRYTNALYKRNEQLLSAAGVRTGIGQPSAANVHWGERAIANPKTDFNHIANTFTAAGVFGQYLHINHKDNQVTVVWCARDVAEHDPMDFETMCFIEAVTDFLNE